MTELERLYKARDDAYNYADEVTEYDLNKVYLAAVDA